ncbi:MAG: hypothetical protein IKM32_01665 [Clostridia bacterium]|nr:hypothetical protein [Clostridia bacterium]
MLDWWVALGSAGQVFACIAIPATVILLIQMVLTLIGLGGDSDADTDGADVDTDTADGIDDVIELDEADEAFEKGEAFDAGLRLFTLRGLIAFFSVMGWVGTICCGEGMHLALSVVISIASGFTAMLVIALLMKWLFSLQYDGTEDVRDALGVSGTVYMRIPPARTGKGKINAIIQGKLCEKYAVTDEETMINRDEEVTVVGISGEETLIVRRKHRR